MNKKLAIVSLLFLGMIGIAKANTTGGGAYPVFMPSSGVVFNDGGVLLGVECSTPASAAQNINQQYIAFFDTSTTIGTGLLAPGGIAISNYTGSTDTQRVVNVTPPIVIQSTNTAGNNGALFLGADWSNWGGIHIKNDLYIFFSLAFPGSGCTVYYDRKGR